MKRTQLVQKARRLSYEIKSYLSSCQREGEKIETKEQIDKYVSVALKVMELEKLDAILTGYIPEKLFIDQLFERIKQPEKKIEQIIPKKTDSQNGNGNGNGNGSKVPFVYFILDGTGKRIKIGQSVQPEKRIQELQTAHVEKLSLLKIIKGSEREIQKRFEKYRLNGEWFFFEGELKDFIESAEEIGVESMYPLFS